MRASPGQDNDIRSRFSAAARSYDKHSLIQDQVAAGVIAMLENVPPADRLLEIGCGTGRLTIRLRRSRPTTLITAIDLSAKMVDQARRNLGDPDDMRWFASDVCEFDSPQPYPLVVSASSLHWVFPIDRAFHAIDGSLESGGHVAIAVMLRGTLRELHASRLRVAPLKPPRATLPDMAKLADAAATVQWQLLHQHEQSFTVRHSGADELLKALHEQGLTGGEVSRAETPLTRGEIKALKSDYDSRHRDTEDRVVATYQVGFMVAKKNDR